MRLSTFTRTPTPVFTVLFGLRAAVPMLTLTQLSSNALISNGDLDTYWTFHTDREHQRLHQARHQGKYALTA
jgi:hypothetical protein